MSHVTQWTTAALGAVALAAALRTVPEAAPSPLAVAEPNDNRAAAGTLRGGVLTVRLDARNAAWRPDPEVDSALTVQAFGERDRPVQVPGPLLRATQGTEVRVTLRNLIPDSTLLVHGLRAGTVRDDTLRVPPGGTREVRFRAGAPGTYLYWGSTSDRPIEARWGRDGPLAGAIVIDPPDARPDPRERIFVLTLVDIHADAANPSRPPTTEAVWEVAINGRSWPHTERLTYTVGDTVRWRWVNGSFRVHPMHLHGFHFRVTAKGDGRVDTAYAAGATRLAVTELIPPGSTVAMAWLPTRAGSWLAHCHLLAHITPFPARADSLRRHDAHDVMRHPLDAMAGLVLGVTTVERDAAAAAPAREAPVAAELRLLVQQARTGDGLPRRRGYVLERGRAPAADSVEVPGSTLVLVRGERTRITVVNRLPEPTSVHWHGMELESYFDGVSGWSGADAHRAPLVAPGDSFAVTMAPPRAGTFIYHTHMDEEDQLPAGLYGALLVLEPGERRDPERDRLLVIGEATEDGRRRHALNGRAEPAPLELRAGTTYRLRLVNILPVLPVTVELAAGGAPVRWRPIAKDGADLPPALVALRPARLRIGVGETYDFTWTPDSTLDAVLEIRFPAATGDAPVRQAIRVRR